MKKILSYLLGALGVGLFILLFFQKPAPVIQEQKQEQETEESDTDLSSIKATPEKPPPYTGDSIISADLIDGARHSAKFIRLKASGNLAMIRIYSDGKLIQEIDIDDTTDYEEYYFADCNFDGYRDLLIRDEETYNGPTYWVLDYIPKSNQYDLNMDLSAEPGLRIDSAHKQIIIHKGFGNNIQNDDTFYYKNKTFTFLHGTTVGWKGNDSLKQIWTYTTRRQGTSTGMIITNDTVIEQYD